MQIKGKITTILIFLTIISSSLYFGFSRLENFSGVDEPYWSYDRVPTFWNAIKNKKWRSTNICDKPGIPLAIVSGIGLPFISDPRDYQSLRQRPKTEEQVQTIRDLYFHLRLPVFIFTLLVLPAFYLLIKKLLGRNIARFSLIFIGLSPILLGISLIINSDSMLWILTALSTLSLFVFFKSSEKKYLLLSGFLLGLSVITKYVANVLFVYFFLLFLLEYILYAHRNSEVGKYLKQAVINYAILFGTALVTAFVFFPATWVKFSILINATIGNPVFSSTWPLFAGVIGLVAIDILLFKTKISTKAFGFLVRYKIFIAKAAIGSFLFLAIVVFLHVYAKVNVFDLQAIISSPKGIGQDLDTEDVGVKTIIAASGEGQGNILRNYTGAILADLYSLMFSVSPLVLFFLLFLAVMILKKKELERDSLTAVYIIIFILIFYLGSAVNNVTTTVRYQIMTYPLAFVAAAIGANWFLDQEKIKKYLYPSTKIFGVGVKQPLAYGAAIVILLASLFAIKPHFLAYASEILPKNMIVNLKGMGEGSVEAAYYLNTLPGAHEMTIWSDKGAVCEAFVGRCFIDFKKKTFTENKIEYFVLSTDRRSRSLKMSGGGKDPVDFAKLYASRNADFEVVIGGRDVNFVKIIRAE